MAFGFPKYRRSVAAVRQLLFDKIEVNNETANFFEELSSSNILQKAMTFRSTAFSKQEDRKIRHLLADFFSCEILLIADAKEQEEGGENKEAAARSKLRIDVRRWLMEQFAPETYGNVKGNNSAGGVKPIKPKIYIPDNGRS